MTSGCDYCGRQLGEGEDLDVHVMREHMPPSPALREWKAEEAAKRAQETAADKRAA